ncbi:hypothetical protein H257_06987 [Aphanomyces astaci]|uniref:Transmembrane protein 230 n=1 Tax=Aphanomyces astaci TaxID=112090 RepID=W4GJ87_APHAT|nr:hypothetical protein H257_06987 [Aphanomyces astaci]ETV79757.1 hypothetical protein H257_06987 [Aphanomyces astaci]|eukprot:XP_009830693.1 hypothetical protein H257_06987 [Aphanomyces astaci]
MMSTVAPREVLEAAALSKDQDDDAATVDIDLKDDVPRHNNSHANSSDTNNNNSSSGGGFGGFTRSTFSFSKVLQPTTSVTAYWTKLKDAVQDSQIPVRTAAAALLLLVVGIVLLILGFVSAVEGNGVSHLFLGVIAFIPGSYATFQLYGAYQGWRGYAFHNLPSYENA